MSYELVKLTPEPTLFLGTRYIKWDIFFRSPTSLPSFSANVDAESTVCDYRDHQHIAMSPFQTVSPELRPPSDLLLQTGALICSLHCPRRRTAWRVRWPADIILRAATTTSPVPQYPHRSPSRSLPQ